MIACVCGGIGELAIIGIVGLIVSAATGATNWYNRHKCAKAGCQHKCHNRRIRRLDLAHAVSGER